MPKVDTTPETLKPYTFHGVSLEWRDGAKDAYGDCPFCGREGKFAVKIDTGLYTCPVCKEGNAKGGGNHHVFIRKLHEVSKVATNSYAELAAQRGFLDPYTLEAWGVVRSVTTNEWLVPAYGIDGHLNQLFKYSRTGDKLKLYGTPGMGLAIFGVNLFDPTKEHVYICESWNAMALWEMLRRTKETGNGYLLTNSEDVSLLSNINVVAIPGCNIFQASWTPLFAGKHVTLFFDNDHPRQHPKTGQTIPPAGYEAVKRTARLFGEAANGPASLSFMRWSNEGYDVSLPPGTDLRDLLKAGGSEPSGRLKPLEQILLKIDDVPEDWFQPSVNGSTPSDSKSLKPKPCDSYKVLISAWRKAMKWTEGLDHGLVAILSCIASTMSVGSQLWFKIIGPASCGKTTLAEAACTSKKYTLPKSTIRGFHSGYKYVDPNTGEEVDINLVSEANGMTLFTKDGDTLLQSPNLGQILSEARDVYDGVARSSFRNGQGKNHENLRMTWVLCGTSSLRSIDSSELGERFLDCVVMEGIDDELEDDILWRVVNKADRNLSIESTGDALTQYPPELMEAMQLTGGYVEYLRENATDLYSQIESPEWALRKVTRYGKFVAFMRARPSEMQDENAEREFAARLVEQLWRYCKSCAVVLQKPEIDEEVLLRARRVALDTGRGKTLQIAKLLWDGGEDGVETKTIAIHINKGEDKARNLLHFMRQIGAAELFSPRSAVPGITLKPRWRLTASLQRLYAEVIGAGL